MKVRIDVTLKPGILDPQGEAVRNALTTFGFTGIRSVRIGKLIEIELAESEPGEVRRIVTDMCEQLLANAVIEDFAIRAD